MTEQEKRLCLVCKVYEKYLREANILNKVSDKALRALQIRDVVNCNDENFKSFLARISSIAPEEYLEYYEYFELETDKEERFNDSGPVTDEPVVNYDPDEYLKKETPFISGEDEEFFEDCATCVYYNDSDDTCETLAKHCTYKKKTEV